MQETLVCVLFILKVTAKTDTRRFNSFSGVVTDACVSTEKFSSNKFRLNITKGENKSDD